MAGTVYVVHCIDTEGPLHESVEATFERLQGDLRPRPRAEPSSCSAACRRARWTWAASRRPCRRSSTLTCSPTTTPGTRSTPCSATASRPRSATRCRDSAGGGWVYNWFCVDHVDYDQQSAPPRHGLPQRLRPLSRACCARRPRAGRPALPLPSPLVQPGGPPVRHALVGVVRQPAPDPLAPGDRPAVVPGREPAGVPRHPSGQPLVPRAVHPVRLLQPGDAPDRGRHGPGRPRGRPLGRLAPGAGHVGAVPPGARRLPGAGRLPPLDRPLPQHRHALPPADRDATCARRSRRPARAGRSCWPSPTTTSATCAPTSTRCAACSPAWPPDFPDVPFRFTEAVTAMRHALGLPTEPACALDLSLERSGDGAHVLRITHADRDLRPAALAGAQDQGRHLPLRQLRHRRAVPPLALRVRRGDVPAATLSRASAWPRTTRIGVTTVKTLDPATGRVTTTLWNLPGTDVTEPGVRRQLMLELAARRLPGRADRPRRLGLRGHGPDGPRRHRRAGARAGPTASWWAS